MDCRRFDVGILTGDKFNPMHKIIHDRTATWMTHAVMFKNDKGDIWDARMSGIEDHHISMYAGRPLTIHSYKHEYDEEAFEAWLAEKLPKSKGYDQLALIGFLLGIESFQDDDRWYCSEVHYRMFQDTGCLITRVLKPFWYPSDTFYSDKFSLVWEGIVGEVH